MINRIKQICFVGLLLVWASSFQVISSGEDKKSFPQLLKDLENPDESIRKTAAEEITTRGDKVKKDAIVKTTKRRDELIAEYKKARLKALETTLKDKKEKEKKDKKNDEVKYLEDKRKEATGLYKERNFEEMAKIVAELMEKFYPTPLIEKEEDKKILSDIAGKIEIIDDSLKKLECEVKPATKILIKMMDEETDDDFQWKVIPARDLKIMEQNKKVKDKLDIEEYRFTVILNKYHIIMGKPAAFINVNLSKAAHGHCKDMKEHDFFDHESPLPGKKTPQQRAALEKAFCSAENIAWARDAAEAFWSWFGSKEGHHEAMFTAGQIGIGFYEGFWTAMF